MKPVVPHKIPEKQPVKTKRRETKPITINDTPTVIDLDTKSRTLHSIARCYSNTDMISI